MHIKSFVFNPFYENTYVVSSQEGNAFIFDPGCYEEYEIEELSEYIDSERLKIKAIINTHCHIDHVLGNEALKTKYEAPLMIPENEVEIFNAVPAYAPQWGITGYKHSDVDDLLKDMHTLSLDEVNFEVLEVSGHSPGHLMFYEKNEKKVIGGDVLFRESIGRTDLPGGNHDDLLKNIQSKVYTLPEKVIVYSGHGSETSIGHEKRFNPFVKA